MEESVYYRQHVFFCTDKRRHGVACSDFGSEAAKRCAKSLLSHHNMGGRGGVRVSGSGCLGRCSEGPVAVIYPEGVWYSYDNYGDVKKLVEEHLLNGNVVEDLRL